MGIQRWQQIELVSYMYEIENYFDDTDKDLMYIALKKKKKMKNSFNPVALRVVKTVLSFGHSERK